MVTMPNQYYQRHDPSKEYEEHLFIAGRGLQSAELNEIQKHAASRLRGIADVLFKDGDIVRDASCQVNADTGAVQCQSGAIYIRGAVRGVAPASFTIPVIGTFAVGVRLTDEVITALEDPSLRDPATGTRNYDEPGAERLRVHAEWGWSGDGVTTGEFFPVYSIENGILAPKEPPPNLDVISQALARYDRDSAGGSYVVSGFNLKALPDVGADQVYSLSEGRARVFGYGIEYPTSRRLVLSAVPDLKQITNEPHLSAGATAQRINFDRSPATNVTAVSITAEKTVSMTHGVFTGAQDQLPDTSVLQILSVTQGATTYTATTDYLLTAGKVDWTPGGAEPAPGSTYSVTYRYITLVTPTLVDDTGLTVTGAVTGTLVLLTYSQKLPRYDRLCLNQEGGPVWLMGVASDSNPQLPSVPSDMLSLASVYQTWNASRRVSNDGVRVVPMPTLAAIDGRMDLLAQLIAQQRLESNIHTREGGTKKGLFVDPFLDDSQRDAGITQTAAIVRGQLMLPINGTVSQVSADITAPTTLTFTHVITLEQSLRTGSMKINPYMSFQPVPARVTLVPSVDRWTVIDTAWAGPSTSRFVVGSGDMSRTTQTTRSVLIASAQTAIETLRSITVSYSIAGFTPGEAIAALTFDGLSMPHAGVVANGSGVASGTFTVPSGLPSGNKSVMVVGDQGNAGTATFSGQGTLERQVWQMQTTITETRWQSPPPPPPPTGGGDPLAQTFTLPATTQVAGIDLWFVTKSTTPARIQLRATSTGLPNATVITEAIVLPTAQVVAAVGISGNHTRVSFPAPVTLIGGVEYAVVALCDDAVGALAVAELGKYDLVAQRWITSQPYTVGVLLSSSNASTWTPHQDRDLAFRLLRPAYTQTSRTVALGNVAVTGATDLILMSYAERPASVTGVDYTLTLPDASVLTVADGQPVQLAAAITGNVTIAARLSGSADWSPVLEPGTQLVSGVVATTADYVTRAIPGGASVAVKVIYEAVVPSGATVEAYYKGIDGGDTWVAMPAPATRNVDDGFVEFIHSVTGVNETAVHIKLVLNGTPAARPRCRDLRVFVM